jgi:hypothetical protein
MSRGSSLDLRQIVAGKPQPRRSSPPRQFLYVHDHAALLHRVPSGPRKKDFQQQHTGTTRRILCRSQAGGAVLEHPSHAGPGFEPWFLGATLEQPKEDSGLLSATVATTWIDFAAA